MRETSTLFLAARGFACVAMDGLSVREQAALFERGEIAVVPHGAALTNLSPAREGAAVVELFPPTHIEASHFATAATESSGTATWSVRKRPRDFTVDVEKLAHLMAAFGLT